MRPAALCLGLTCWQAVLLRPPALFLGRTWGHACISGVFVPGACPRDAGELRLSSTQARATVHHSPWPCSLQALLHRITDEVSMLLGDRGWRARVKPQTISNLANA